MKEEKEENVEEGEGDETGGGAELTCSSSGVNLTGRR